MAYEKTTFSSGMSETCKINLQVDSKISLRGVCFVSRETWKITQTSLIWRQQPGLRYHLCDYKDKDNGDTMPRIPARGHTKVYSQRTENLTWPCDK
jgi:hypothetical protein